MSCARLLLLAVLPTLAGVCGEVVSVTEAGGGGGGAGGGPTFAPRQRTSVVAAVGQSATLDCRVTSLGDKAVSWVRSRDLQILSHAGAVFTADARVSAARLPAGGRAAVSRHALTIERLRLSDSGRYECQLNSEPKMSLFYNLTVVDEPVPRVVVSALGSAGTVTAAGGAATLACEAHYEPPPRALPLPPLDIRWRRRGDNHWNLEERRGVRLDTERWRARVESRLTLAALDASDAGEYDCVAANHTATIRLLTDAPEERMEMQRDEAGSGAARGLAAVSFTPLLAAALPVLLAR